MVALLPAATSPATSSAIGISKGPHPNVLQATAGAGCKLPDLDLAAPGRQCARLRQTVIYLAHTRLRLPYRQLSGLFARSVSTIRHACRVVEDRRDDPGFDLWLDELAASLPAISGPFPATLSTRSPPMPKSAALTLRATPDALPRQALQLLRLLAEHGAYAIAAGADEPDRLIVVAPSKGVSLRQNSVNAATGVTLAAHDLAHWQPPGNSGRARLAISPAGLAKLARLDAPRGIDPFTAQHATLVAGEVVLPASGPQPVVLDCAESPLAWLARRRGKNGQPLIDAVRFQAGERLRNDLTLAQMLPHVTANWGNPASGGGFDAGSRNYSDLVIAARQRIDRAFDAVGSDMSGLLLDICGFLKGLEQIECERQWPARSGKVVLTLALGRLAAHYGLSGEARGPARSRGIRQWGAEGWRPSF